MKKTYIDYSLYNEYKRREQRRIELREAKAKLIFEHLKSIKQQKAMQNDRAKNPFILTAITLAILAVVLFMYLGKTSFSYGMCGMLCLGSFVSTAIYLINKKG